MLRVQRCSKKEVRIHFDGSLTDKNEEVAVTECLGRGEIKCVKVEECKRS